MNNFRPRPFYEGMRRKELSEQRRSSAASYSSTYAALPTATNNDETELAEESYVANFTKGLPHNEFAQLETAEHYQTLVNQINQQDAETFDEVERGLNDLRPAKTIRVEEAPNKPVKPITWRGWESPRAGHYFDLQGPDADAVSMPAAPELGSDELTAEMAEVYALALLRDIPFSQISDATGIDPETGISAKTVLRALGNLSWFSDTDNGTLTLQKRRRRAARRIDHGPDFAIDSPPDNTPFLPSAAFRGSGPGAKAGPYVSQFLLLGNKMGKSGDNFDDSSIAYGRQVIDQKIETLRTSEDYLIHWNAYLDVQNGADFTSDTDKGIESTRRFITTPRDIATYVRYDALYQAYLNACLYMLGDGGHFGAQQPVRHRYTGALGPGFPDGGGDSGVSPPSRQAFAVFGGPHVLSLVTEVATRCLKAVRRQKFNYHRRARPERLGALFTVKGTQGLAGDNDVSDELGSTTSSHLGTMMNAMNLGPLLDLVHQHNDSRLNNNHADPHLDFSTCTDPAWFSATKNFLLPMAFAEGSPMHPSYGAGHATVAGGCVTMLKAFFNTTDADGGALPWPNDLPVVQANTNGDQLEPVTEKSGMTISSELNKLAANISIARNMAGVHYYTDYYESLRMGERIAVGMLIEQLKHYNEPCEFSFESFDGDFVHLLKNDFDYGEPRVYIVDSKGEDVVLDSWWLRHVKLDESETAPLFAENSSTTESTTEETA